MQPQLQAELENQSRKSRNKKEYNLVSHINNMAHLSSCKLAVDATKRKWSQSRLQTVANLQKNLELDS